MKLSVLNIFVLFLGNCTNTQFGCLAIPEPDVNVNVKINLNGLVGNANGMVMCPPGFEQSGIYCYWFSSDRGITATWPEAQSNCASLGVQLGLNVHLAEFCNCGSDEWLMRTITSKGEECFLGANDPGRNGTWFWVQSGRVLSMENAFFGPTEPNHLGRGTENCLVTWKFGNRDPKRQYIGDYTCSIVEHYVCQIFN